MIGEPEGQAVGQTAGDGNVLGRELAADLRKLGLVARKARGLVAEAHGQFRVIGNGFHRGAQDALEFLCFAFTGLCHWRMCLQAMATWADDFGNSSPKQRW